MKAISRKNQAKPDSLAEKTKRLTGSLSARSITTEQINIVDAKGNQRASLRTEKNRTVFEMSNGNGQAMLNIIVGDNGETSINIYSHAEIFDGPIDRTRTVKRVQIGEVPMSKKAAKEFYRTHTKPRMVMFDGNGQERVDIGVYPVGTGYARLDSKESSIALDSGTGLLMHDRNTESLFLGASLEKARFNHIEPHNVISESQTSDRKHDDFGQTLKLIAETKPEAFRFFVALLLPEHSNLSSDEVISLICAGLNDEVFRQSTERAFAALRRLTQQGEPDTDSEGSEDEKPFKVVVQELAEPLARFLDHSRMPEDIAGKISDALLELADFKQPATSNGKLSADALYNIAGHLSE